jgi:hypothetical protein
MKQLEYAYRRLSTGVACVIEQLAQSRGSHWKPIGDFIVLQQFVL